MRAISAAIFLFFPWYFSTAQTPLSGKADSDYIGQSIKLYAVSDFLTFQPSLLATDTIGPGGGFTLSYTLPEATLGKLYIGEIAAYVYLDPAESLRLSFPNYTSVERMILSKDKVVQLGFESDEGQLNQNILVHNEQFDAFVAKYFFRFQNNEARSYVDSFLLATKDSCQGCDQSYFKTYREYNRALLKLNSYHSKVQLYHDYLHERPVQLNNDAYTDFIKQYFEGYFKNISLTERGVELKRSINAFKSMPKLLEVIARDSVLTDPQLQEWVAMKELYNNIHNDLFDRNSILWMLQSLAESAQFPEHRTIAKNMVKTLTNLGPGTRAPEFALRTLSDSLVALRDFRGQYVYLQFWAPWCTSCINDMSKIKDYKEKYGNSIKFVSVMIQGDSTDQNYERMVSNFDWVFLKDELGVESLRSRYDVRTVPLYFLISKEGYLEMCQAAGPGYAIEIRLYNIDKANFPDKYRKNLIIQD